MQAVFAEYSLNNFVIDGFYVGKIWLTLRNTYIVQREMCQYTEMQFYQVVSTCISQLAHIDR